MRAVFDTNIFISAFGIPGGNADEAYLHAVRGTFELFTSVAILTETATTLQTKFQWSDEKVRQLLQAISKTATVVRTQPHLHLLALQCDENTRIVNDRRFPAAPKGRVTPSFRPDVRSVTLGFEA